MSSPPRVSEPAPPDLLSSSSDSHVELEFPTNVNVENKNKNVTAPLEQCLNKTFIGTPTCTVAVNNQYVETTEYDKHQITGKQSKRPFSYPCGLVCDNAESAVADSRKRYSDPPKIVNVTNSRGKAQVKPFTKESLERLERRTVQLVREYGFQPKRKLSVEDGSRLPPKYEPFPSSLYGRPLEEIDNFIYDEILFFSNSGGMEIIKLSYMSTDEQFGGIY
ncbi:hypothetical protein RN001_001022 [Aquatica leii]|uniref:Uncharacterized protein n=1 Tax=Aquatica leii TaxID=1421715 RepID=A0AAN7PN10_9COLE|nr:hypothetical protein RN001_001022 [Aquatica leii]